MIKNTFIKYTKKYLENLMIIMENCLDNIIKNDLVLRLASIVTEWIFPILLKVQK